MMIYAARYAICAQFESALLRYATPRRAYVCRVGMRWERMATLLPHYYHYHAARHEQRDVMLYVCYLSASDFQHHRKAARGVRVRAAMLFIYRVRGASFFIIDIH